MLTAKIYSNSHPNEKTYDATAVAVLAVAEEFGTCDGGEVVELWDGEKQVAEARWTPENGGKYYDCLPTND